MKAVPFPISPNHTAIVDEADLPWLNEYHWHPIRKRRCIYAIAVIETYTKPRIVWMHRLVARTPAHMVCHHRDRNTLNNTPKNLINMTRHDHMILHRDNHCLVKYKNGPGYRIPETSPDGTAPGEETRSSNANTLKSI